MQKWQCTVCGYIYDPDVGDPEKGIPPGTAFEVLPADWTCPVCGAAKDMFEEYKGQNREKFIKKSSFFNLNLR